ncbi:metallophosphoesterase family protein [Hyphobacterium sp.]|uniref:metallophosphoesterase family protein n=1 Tax=Hyphobacterium sp. TaxID=2004662 RepID=UPI003BAB0714
MTRLVHIADLHFGDEDARLVADFIDGLGALSADVVVVAGDLTQTGSKREFAQAAEFLEAIKCPTVLTPGNHDTPLLNIGARLTRPWRRLQKAIGEHADDRWWSEAVQIESFNSSRGTQLRLDWSLGVVSEKKLTDPLAALDASEAATKVLTAHHPIVSPLAQRGRARTLRADKFAKPIASAADLILTGHLHQSFACPLDIQGRRSWFVGAATAFSSRTRDEPAGFNVIEAEAASFDWTRYVASEGRFEKTDTSRLDRKL